MMWRHGVDDDALVALVDEQTLGHEQLQAGPDGVPPGPEPGAERLLGQPGPGRQGAIQRSSRRAEAMARGALVALPATFRS